VPDALLDLQQTAVTELVNRTEEAGLIKRQPSLEDGRVRLLLTAEGERRLLRAFNALRDDAQPSVKLSATSTAASAPRAADACRAICRLKRRRSSSRPLSRTAAQPRSCTRSSSAREFMLNDPRRQSNSSAPIGHSS
jgi:DNA-binding transcriptional ArsR family regulator